MDFLTRIALGNESLLPRINWEEAENLIKSNKFDVAKCKAIILTYDVNTFSSQNFRRWGENLRPAGT
jgi:hypothetical protein